MGAREVERLGDGRASERAKEKFEGGRGLESWLSRVVVREREGVVVRLGVADEDRDDVVREFGGEGGVCEVFEGELQVGC